MNEPIAIVGMACIFPDANSPMDLWENVLAQRRAFRRIPSERLALNDYHSSDPKAMDKTYGTQAAVIQGYEFDRVKFKVVGSTFRQTDMTHWLALDVAARALEDAGFKDGLGLPRESTGVIMGNTLTGEFSRANIMRLRWPFVRRTLEAALKEEDFSSERKQDLIDRLESLYKEPFPEVGDETLAGGLSNTIAGRICNQFDLKGGGYTLDGACASSLLAVANSCSSLVAGDLDVAIAGGVDLSLDPFEIIGFSKVGALAKDSMKIYDSQSTGFWPGEGCGLVVLMRHEDALAQGQRIYALIRGWGISSDGNGGITRPEAEGQLQALHRAYRRSGFGADSVALFEGHGTGTQVGDATELDVLTRIRKESNSDAPPAAIGSVKANIGHTKAAAGVAGLIKATLAIHNQVLPPTTGCQQPHAKLCSCSPALRVLNQPEIWPTHLPLRVGVSAMGFGGINAHLVLENTSDYRRKHFSPREQMFSQSKQELELFTWRADDLSSLRQQVDQVLNIAARISRSEMIDLAAALADKTDQSSGSCRAAILAADPEMLTVRIHKLANWLSEGITRATDLDQGIFLGDQKVEPSIGFLFPGQGSPANLDGGVYIRRFKQAKEIFQNHPVCSEEGNTVATQVAQPGIARTSLIGLRLLESFGICAQAAIGHSLGEITAMHWANAFDAPSLLEIAHVRSQAMANLGHPHGAMAAISAPWQEVEKLLNGDEVVVSGFNSPNQTVISGDQQAVMTVSSRAKEHGFHSVRLPVSHAFHTALVKDAIPTLRAHLGQSTLGYLEHPVYSTITGKVLPADVDIQSLLCQQVTHPVRFIEAFQSASNHETKMDVWIEVGPGQVLAGLAKECLQNGSDPSPLILSMDACGPSLDGLLQLSQPPLPWALPAN